MSMTFSESTSGKSSDFEYQSRWLCGCGPWRWCKGVGEIHMDRGRVGEESKGKETDGCPLTSPPLQRRGVTTHEDRQEVARSALVNGIESKMAALIWRLCEGVCGGIALSSTLCVAASAPPIDYDFHHSLSI
jgi:hypothetical protein